MNILAIETTGPLASAALLKDGLLSQKVNNTEYSHLEQIVPMTKVLLEECGAVPEALDAIAVSEGPGSFTGQRIGMATVKGLAQIWKKPVVSVPTLASFAYGNYSWMDTAKKYLLCPLFDARRNQVYAGAFEFGSYVGVIEGAPYDFDEFIGKIKLVSSNYDEIIFFGDGSDAYIDKLNTLDFSYSIAPRENRYQLAGSVVLLGEKLLAEGKVTTCYDSAPNYMREAEAERKLKEKKNGQNV